MGSISVTTEELQAGDLVVGSERQEIMVAPPGLTVAYNVGDNGWGAIGIVWEGNPKPEFFNRYWNWYVVRKEKENGATEEGPV